MPTVTLNPGTIVSSNGWTNPANIASDNNVYSTYAEATEGNALLIRLNSTGLASNIDINSVRVGLGGLFVQSKTPATGLIGVQILKASNTSAVYYDESLDFNNNPLSYLQTLRTEASSGVNWTVGAAATSVDDLALKITVIDGESSFPIFLDHAFIIVDYIAATSPFKITEGIIKLTSGKVTI